MIELLLYTIIIYFTNASCTLSKLLSQHPLDFGTGLLGDGKTIEGLIIGLNAGLITAFFIGLDFRVSLFVITAALSGDLFGSFIKRRLGLERGQELPLLDQLGFIVFAYIALSFFIEFDLWLAFLLILVTYFVHKLSNKLACALGLKSVPW